jgi:allantoinase
MRAFASDRICTPGRSIAGAVLEVDGRIVDVVSRAAVPPEAELVECGALALAPGLVDLHVHCNDPGREHWEGFWTATRAAAAGGITTLVDMPLNSTPATTTVRALEAKQRAAAGRLHVDVAMHGGLVPGNLEDLPGLAQAGVVGFKAFLAPSGVDDFSHVSLDDLRRAAPTLERLGLPLLVHAELVGEAPAISDPRAYGQWLASRPESFELEAAEGLIELAAATGIRIHVVHVASALALGRLLEAKRTGLEITLETCPHYLTFAAEEIPDGDPRYKCAPPIRSARHREALWQALGSGKLDTIGSDHSPAPAELKCLDSGDLARAWGGIASLELLFPAVWTGACARGIPLEVVVPAVATRPAALIGLGGTKGAIEPGADADLVAVDLEAEWEVRCSELHQRHPATPYEGRVLRGRVESTWLRGLQVFRRDESWGPPRGRLIRVARGMEPNPG